MDGSTGKINYATDAAHGFSSHRKGAKTAEKEEYLFIYRRDRKARREEHVFSLCSPPALR
jgi:hypothetical protein